MKIYTKTGDLGETGLFGGTRISKASRRVEAYGEVDELNSVLGLVRLYPIDELCDSVLAAIQSQLFDVGAELANPGDKKLSIALVSEKEIEAMELAIDRAELELEPLKTFVLPGGSKAAAHLHLARTVCRRAERRVVELAQMENVRGEVIRYLNRLSDLCFVLARLANKREQVADVPWVGRSTDRATQK